MYGSLDQLKKRLPESELIMLTDDDSTGEFNEAVFQELAAGVDELIDSHLRGRFALPLNSVPGIISAIALDLYLFELYGRRPTFEIPKTVETKRNNQMRVLVGIKKGDIQLGIAGVATPAAATSINSIQVAGGNPQVFTAESLKNF